MADIVRVIVSVDNAAPTDVSHIREVIVEDDKKYGSEQTSLGNSLLSYVLCITKFGLNNYNLFSVL